MELFNASGPNDVIRRVMTLDGASQYLVNHKESSASAVQARMRNFGIQGADSAICSLVLTLRSWQFVQRAPAGTDGAVHDV